MKDLEAEEANEKVEALTAKVSSMMQNMQTSRLSLASKLSDATASSSVALETARSLLQGHADDQCGAGVLAADQASECGDEAACAAAQGQQQRQGEEEEEVQSEARLSDVSCAPDEVSFGGHYVEASSSSGGGGGSETDVEENNPRLANSSAPLSPEVSSSMQRQALAPWKPADKPSPLESAMQAAGGVGGQPAVGECASTPGQGPGTALLLAESLATPSGMRAAHPARRSSLATSSSAGSPYWFARG